MEAELWHKIEELFQAALAQPSGSRATFLREACAGDGRLQREVETLLENASEDSSFLQDSPLTGAALSKGQKLGNFEILEAIGSGGMGEVYRAYDARLKRHVAIKVLPRAFARDAERLARFQREARAASALNHPNIVCVYDIGRQDDTAWIASELVEGQSLRQILAKGPLPLRRVIEIARQVADGLAAAHAVGLVHRDLKPENVMLARDGRIKILDFGLAKRQISAAMATSTELTRPGIVSGTPAYMSPEQISCRMVDQRSDIFSLGVVTYEMLAGRRPFTGDTSISVMNAALADEPADLPAAVPSSLTRLVLHCLEKEPERRLQSAADLSFALQTTQELYLAASPEKHRSTGLLVLAAALAWVATIAVFWSWSVATKQATPPLVLTRITAEAGLTTDPALSPDGKLLAYASDRSGNGNLDIWVQQTAGGAPIRLTRNEADDSQPSFSPDGSMITFRSERDGGGIYVVSALGGDERLVARQGLRPRFSPDGREIAYFVGHSDGDLFSRNTGKVYVVESTGGAPRQIQKNFIAARYPIWSPDGKHLLFIGTEDAPKKDEAWDWYVTAVHGGPAVKTGAFQAIGKQKLLNNLYVVPLLWVSGGNRILFAGRLGDSINLWQLQIAEKDWSIRDAPGRITSGTGIEANAAVAGNRLAFTASAQNANIWTLPINSAKGELHGVIQRSTENPAFDAITDITRDGNQAVFTSNRMGHNAAWIKDFNTGKDTMLSGRNQRVGSARITADASRVGYDADEQDKPIYTVPALGGMPEKLCERCGSYWNWSSDGKRILYVWRDSLTIAPQIFLFDTESKKRVPILQNPAFNLYEPSFSPDERWVAFHARTQQTSLQQFVAPFRGERIIPEAEWISIGEGDTLHWSPDGNGVYSIADRDGFNCLWFQRLDPENKKPIGKPLCIQHFHRARLSLVEFGVARTKIAMSLSELSGNIWMANLDGTVTSRPVN